MPSTRSGARLLVDQLLIQGVNHAFCVPGESYLAVLDALYDAREMIKLIINRHESGATFMADAYAKLTGQPGVAFVTRGPGASNAAIGIHTAFQDSTPVILFIGQVGNDFVGARGLPGSRLPAHVRADDQVGGAGRPRRARAGIRRARLPDRHERAARPRRAGPAGRHAVADGRCAGCAVPPAGARRAERRPGRGAAPPARPGAAPDRDPRRHWTGRQPRATTSSALPKRTTCRWPARSGTRICSTTGTRTTSATSASASIRSSAQRIKDADLVIAVGARLGRDDDRGLHPARGSGADAVAGPRARGLRGTRSRVPGAADDQRRNAAVRVTAGDDDADRRAGVARIDFPGDAPITRRGSSGRRSTPTREPALDLWEVVQILVARRAGRRHHHQRRRQLLDLGPPVLALHGHAHAARADRRVDGLRRAGRHRRQDRRAGALRRSASPATATSR